MNIDRELLRKQAGEIVQSGYVHEFVTSIGFVQQGQGRYEHPANGTTAQGWVTVNSYEVQFSEYGELDPFVSVHRDCKGYIVMEKHPDGSGTWISTQYRTIAQVKKHLEGFPEIKIKM